jgi:hypothetical protein
MHTQVDENCGSAPTRASACSSHAGVISRAVPLVRGVAPCPCADASPLGVLSPRGSPTYLPTYLLTNLPAAAYGFNLPAQSSHDTHERVRTYPACLYMGVPSSTHRDQVAVYVPYAASPALTHRCAAYSPPYGPLRSRRVSHESPPRALTLPADTPLRPPWQEE